MEQPTPGANATPQSDGAPKEKQSREQSSIQFPYGDLSDAISVAQALLACGGVPCDPDQLAGALKQVPTSGAFRQKIATARTFGVIETVQGKYQLTDLGFAITDGARQKAAKVEAFLAVPLYRKVYDTFRNQQLPPRPVALERTFVGFGVAQKQADRARHAFDRSAQQAGFFDQGGRDRLIRPPVTSAGSVTSQSEANETPADQPPPSPPPLDHPRNGSGSGGGYHPFIEGLLKTLPAPETVWAIEGRAAWLEAAASVFKLLYRGDGKITVTANPEGTQQKSGASH